MRTQWTTKGNRDAGLSCSCDGGLRRYRYLHNFGGGGLNPPLGTPLLNGTYGYKVMIMKRVTPVPTLSHTDAIHTHSHITVKIIVTGGTSSLSHWATKLFFFFFRIPAPTMFTVQHSKVVSTILGRPMLHVGAMHKTPSYFLKLPQ